MDGLNLSFHQKKKKDFNSSSLLSSQLHWSGKTSSHEPSTFTPCRWYSGIFSSSMTCKGNLKQKGRNSMIEGMALQLPKRASKKKKIKAWFAGPVGPQLKLGSRIAKKPFDQSPFRCILYWLKKNYNIWCTLDSIHMQ